MTLLTGRFAVETGENIITASMYFHIGANMDQRERVNIGTMTSQGLGVRDIASNDILSLSSPDSANRSIGVLDAALLKINKQRADLGAYQNRLRDGGTGDRRWSGEHAGLGVPDP